MENQIHESALKLEDVFVHFRRARNAEGPPQEFWPEFLQGCVALVAGSFGVVLVRDEEQDAWRSIFLWPQSARAFLRSSGVGARVEALAPEVAHQGELDITVSGQGSTNQKVALVGVSLELPEGERQSVIIVGIDDSEGVENHLEAVTRLKLVADIPFFYLLRRGMNQARVDVSRFSEALDLMVLLNVETRYMGAAMTFCNEIAARYQCDRVSLGWLDSGYVRLQAISHIEKFEKKMAVVQSLEAVMEEAVSQDEEVLCPRPEGSSTVTRDHENFAREQSVGQIASFPVRLNDELVGAVVCERSEKVPFTISEIQAIRLASDQAARRLGDLREHDRWFGARMAASIKKGLSGLLGVEHTFAKLIGVLVTVVLAILIFGKMDYRVEAPFLVKTDDVAYLPAAFDGYIDQVYVDIGDLVHEGDLLLTLDMKELLLQESNAIANKVRYERESEKARAANSLADMKIAQALADQAAAELELVRYQLNNAEIKAPFAGILVEGDLKEMLGAPVRKGDVLFKIARIDKIYAELDVDQKDIHDVLKSSTGEIAFVSKPKEKFLVAVTRIDPVAVVKDEGNVFVVRGEFKGAVQDWWRPGMSGIGKIEVGRRNILWIISHRTVDFLRIFFWW